MPKFIATGKPQRHAMTAVEIPSLPTITDCDGCGACCLHMGYPTFLMPNDDRPGEEQWESMPAPLKRDLLRYIESYSEPPDGQLDGPCIWFDPEKRLCKHHAHRPRVCRDFRVGGGECRAWRRHYGDKLTVDPNA